MGGPSIEEAGPGDRKNISPVVVQRLTSQKVTDLRPLGPPSAPLCSCCILGRRTTAGGLLETSQGKEAEPLGAKDHNQVRGGGGAGRGGGVTVRGLLAQTGHVVLVGGLRG